ncbi:M16 family metallopeptidase [Kutzneria kofuensis]|uniref:Putative Zn-dependent peptidase n=1 Tax=Kutzneria kofuensis TaxID=103725 RepID=A0A7W9NJ79_9PSEU|nr:insulinase family protein [Kutzneria kofuensis]MBB5894066.1 putative Zn-dependent peptidase [Kutzneria kofuensis]
MIKETEVCGIRTLVAPGNGPLAAGLAFRVGCADEPLSRRGLTHLVEHLALHRHGLIEHDANAATGVTITHFFTSGSEQAVVSYLTSVCDSLRDLPLERIATEKTILRTEQAGRPHDSLLVWRYGAVGFGAAGYPEWGLEAITDADVRDWAATRFTRENAVLWIAGEVPEGLNLTLPSGSPQPLPELTSALPTTPAYFTEGSGKVTFSAIVERSARASLFAMVLERALFRALRTEDGNSYAVATAYMPRDGEHATITAMADALPEKQDAVLGGLIDVLAAFRVGRVDADELETVRDKASTSLDRPEAGKAILFTEAVDVLYGRTRASLTDFRAELAAVTVEDLRDMAVQAMDTLLLQVPRGNQADWAGFAEAPMWSEKATVGEKYPSLQNGDFSLVLGYDGVSMESPHGALTVRYRECVLMQCWPDGARRLVGPDGVSVSIEPTLHDVPERAIARLDKQIGDELKVWQPARPADRIPQPPAPAPVQPVMKVEIPLKAKLTLALIALLCPVLALVATAALVTSDNVGHALLHFALPAWGAFGAGAAAFRLAKALGYFGRDESDTRR